MAADQEQIHLRVDRKLLQRVFRFIEDFRKTQAVELSVTAAITSLLTRALDAHEGKKS